MTGKVAETPKIDLGIAGLRVPLHSHIAGLLEMENDLDEALGFVETGLRGSDHCVVIGDAEDLERITGGLRNHGFDIDGLQARKRLTVLQRTPSGQEMADGLSRALEAALAAGASLVRLFGIAGWDRETGPSDAELFSYEARLTEMAERLPCVILCLHEVNVTTGSALRYGVLGTHPRTLVEGSLFDNPFFVPFERAAGRFSAVSADLSRQQETRQTVRRETEILRAIFESAPVMISFYDTEGRLLFVNREWERIMGWSLEDARNTDILAEAYPDPESLRRVREFVQRAEGRWSDFRTRTRDGRWLDTSWIRYALSDGTRIGLGLDISDRKRLEREIEATEAVLAEGEKLSHTGTWALNLASGNLFWSAESFRIFGLEPGQETMSHPLFHELLRPADYAAAANTVPLEDRSAIQERVARAVAERSGFEADHGVIRPDGSVRQVHSVGRPVFDESGELVELVGVLTDVTEQRLAETRLRRSHKELRALSERLRNVREEEGTRIAREVHDEIGQALTALQMDVAWLAKRLGAPGAAESENLPAKLRSMSELLDQTIAAVQRIATELRPAVLDELGLEASIEWYVREFEKRTGIVCGFRSELGAEHVDPERATAIFRILQEALTNVARHSGSTRVEIRLSAGSNRLSLEVADDGRGLPEDRLEVFESLGLLGMRERARSLGGGLSIGRASPSGTVITLTIPP